MTLISSSSTSTPPPGLSLAVAGGPVASTGGRPSYSLPYSLATSDISVSSRWMSIGSTVPQLTRSSSREAASASTQAMLSTFSGIGGNTPPPRASAE